MAQKDSAYTNMIEELRLKKDIESARCLIESGDLNSARRLLDKSYKHASKTLKGYQQSIERLLEECWKGKVIFGNSISRFVLFPFLGTFQNSVAYPAHHHNLPIVFTRPRASLGVEIWNSWQQLLCCSCWHLPPARVRNQNKEMEFRQWPQKKKKFMLHTRQSTMPL